MFQVSKRIFAVVLCIAMVMLFAMPAFAAEEAAGETLAESVSYGQIKKSVTFREGPSTAYSKLDKIKKGETVIVMDNTGSWWQVEYDGQVGYVHSSYIKLTTDAPAAETQPTAELTSAINVAEQAVPVTSTTTTTPVAATDPLADKINKARAKNTDCIGWIEVPGTKISDPICYRSDFYYAYYNINRQKSYEGVYTQYGSLQKNNPLYGHNLRKSNDGFHDLHHLQEVALGQKTCMSDSCSKKLSGYGSWYKTAEGRTWNISLFGKTKWEVFAMYEVKQNEPKSTLAFNYTPSISDHWLNYQLQRSQINFGVPVTTADTILTVITCGDNYDSASAQSRLYTFLKCVG